MVANATEVRLPAPGCRLRPQLRRCHLGNRSCAGLRTRRPVPKCFLSASYGESEEEIAPFKDHQLPRHIARAGGRPGRSPARTAAQLPGAAGSGSVCRTHHRPETEVELNALSQAGPRQPPALRSPKPARAGALILVRGLAARWPRSRFASVDCCSILVKAPSANCPAISPAVGATPEWHAVRREQVGSEA